MACLPVVTPYQAPTLVCAACGQNLVHEAVLNHKKDAVVKLVYRHEATANNLCKYTFEASLKPANGTMYPIPEVQPKKAPVKGEYVIDRTPHVQRAQHQPVTIAVPDKAQPGPSSNLHTKKVVPAAPAKALSLSVGEGSDSGNETTATTDLTAEEALLADEAALEAATAPTGAGTEAV